MAVSVSFNGNAAGLDRTIQKTTQEAAKLDEAYKRTVKTSREADRAAQRWLKDGQTEAQKYKQILQGLNQQVKAGVISHQQAARAAASYKEQVRHAHSITPALVSGVGSLAAGWVSVSSAISAAMASLQEYQRLQDNASKKTLTIAQEQELLLQNVGTKATAKQKSQLLNVEIPAMARDTGVPEEAILAAMRSSISAQGGTFEKRVPRAKEVVSKIAKMTRQNPEQIAILSGLIFDYADSIGPDADYDMLISSVVNSGSQARSEILSKQSRLGRVTSAFATSSPEGNKTENFLDSLAFGVAYSNFMKDKDLELVASGSINIAESMFKRFENTEHKGVYDRIQAILDMPEGEKRKFLEGVGGEAAFRANLLPFFTRGSEHNKLFEEIRGEIVPDTAALKDAVGFIQSGTPELRAASALTQTLNKATLGTEISHKSLVGTARSLLFGDGTREGVLSNVDMFTKARAELGLRTATLFGDTDMASAAAISTIQGVAMGTAPRLNMAGSFTGDPEVSGRLLEVVEQLRGLRRDVNAQGNRNLPQAPEVGAQ